MGFVQILSKGKGSFRGAVIPQGRLATDTQKYRGREGGNMFRLPKALVHFLRAEDGPTAVEYAVMLALIIVVCITAIGALGSNANKIFSNVSLNAAASSS
jgi:pilus assembly protein Flp/PilA